MNANNIFRLAVILAPSFFSILFFFIIILRIYFHTKFVSILFRIFIIDRSFLLHKFFPQICDAIEIAEHEQHKYILYCHYECYQFRITAIRLENDLHEMQHEQQKLYHLHLGDVFLPPYRSFDILVDCADQIVSVHNGVHQTVEHTHHRTMSGWQKSNTNPYTQDHGTVMVHMQECDVRETFAHHEKYLTSKGEICTYVAVARIQFFLY